MSQTMRMHRALAGCLSLTALLLAQTTVSSSGGVATAAKDVCGGLLADAAFTEEVPVIGVEHACEHLRGRQQAKAGIPAVNDHSGHHRTSGPATHSVALAGEDPAAVGSWSAAVNPGTKTVGISAVLLHTGKVLLFGGKYKSTDKNTAAYLYDPVPGPAMKCPRQPLCSAGASRS